MRKLTAQRQADILRVLRSGTGPMTAYEILSELRMDEPDIAPPTVYRTLSFLTEQGRAHRLESLKAFVPCQCDHADSVAVLAICEACGAVEEHDGSGLRAHVDALVAPTAFSPSRHIVELHGRCGTCAQPREETS